MSTPRHITRQEVLSLPKKIAEGWEFINPNDSFQAGYRYFVDLSSMGKYEVIDAIKKQKEFCFHKAIIHLQRSRSRSYEGCPKAAFELGIKRAAEGLGYTFIA